MLATHHDGLCGWGHLPHPHPPTQNPLYESPEHQGIESLVWLSLQHLLLDQSTMQYIYNCTNLHTKPNAWCQLPQQPPWLTQTCQSCCNLQQDRKPNCQLGGSMRHPCGHPGKFHGAQLQWQNNQPTTTDDNDDENSPTVIDNNNWHHTQLQQTTIHSWASWSCCYLLWYRMNHGRMEPVLWWFSENMWIHNDCQCSCISSVVIHDNNGDHELQHNECPK